MYNKGNRFCPNNKHNLELYNEYHNLYFCDRCNSYWTPTNETKTRITWSFTIVDFSTNDDRIINVYCKDLVDRENRDKIKLLKNKITLEEYYYGKKRRFLTKEEKRNVDEKREWKNKCKLMYSK